MTGRRLARLIVLSGATTLLVVPPSTAAKPGYFVWPAVRESQVSVKGTNGFDVTIARTAGWIELTASDGSTAAHYVIRHRRHPSSGDGIHATFPGLGRISLRFRPSGRLKREPSFCGGRASIQRFGAFRGVIRFKGELGYTRVASNGGRGHTFRSFREVCKDSSESTSTPDYSLEAMARSRGRSVSFYAFRSIEGWFNDDQAIFTALSREKRRGMVILRNAFARAPRSGLALAGPRNGPDSATVEPPAPFSGAANFHAPPGVPAEWTGDLVVELPGAGVVPLTGPSFKSRLCMNRRCVGHPR